MYFSVSFGSYVLEILIGPLFASLCLLTDFGFDFLTVLDFILETFFFTLLVLGIFSI
jgi:hypothetical protein